MDEFQARLLVVSTTLHVRSQLTVEGSVSQWQLRAEVCVPFKGPLEDRIARQNTQDTVLLRPSVKSHWVNSVGPDTVPDQ